MSKDCSRRGPMKLSRYGRNKCYLPDAPDKSTIRGWPRGRAAALTVHVGGDGSVDPSDLLSCSGTVHVPSVSRPLESDRAVARYVEMANVPPSGNCISWVNRLSVVWTTLQLVSRFWTGNSAVVSPPEVPSSSTLTPRVNRSCSSTNSQPRAARSGCRSIGPPNQSREHRTDAGHTRRPDGAAHLRRSAARHRRQLVSARRRLNLFVARSSCWNPKSTRAFARRAGRTFRGLREPRYRPVSRRP